MIETRVIPVTAFAQNCTLLWCAGTRKAVVVDPGGDLPLIQDAISEAGLTVERILITHGHIDHAGGAAQLARTLNVPIDGPQEEDAFWLDGLPEQSRMFGFPGVEAFTPARWLHDGDTVTVGEETLHVIHAPGHTPGHIVFFHRAARLALVGDVLFAGSIGRTDFPRGNHGALLASIRDKLFSLGDDIEFISGHGPNSTFGRERLSNPYVGEGRR
jgi:glyoxylase-like metal-dependent hydrolase (beta-lactamase superfamily II)